MLWGAWVASLVGDPGLGDGQALSGSCADQVGFEFRDHSQDAEKEPADGISGFVGGAFDVTGRLIRGKKIVQSGDAS